MSAWESFFVAEVGASAVLVGLVFVGLSINLDKIHSRVSSFQKSCEPSR